METFVKPSFLGDVLSEEIGHFFCEFLSIGDFHIPFYFKMYGVVDVNFSKVPLLES